MFSLHLYRLIWSSHIRKKRLLSLLCSKRKLQIRQRGYVHSSKLILPKDSPFEKLWNFGSDDEIIEMIGISRNAFLLLLKNFEKFYVVKSGPRKRGRPPRLYSKRLVLGLILCFYRNSIKYRVLGSWFGVPISTLSRVIRAGEKALYAALRITPMAAVKWPTLEQQMH